MSNPDPLPDSEETEPEGESLANSDNTQQPDQAEGHGAEGAQGAGVNGAGEREADEGDAESSRLRARRERIAAWNQAGATSVPALIVATFSAITGAIALVWRRRRRK